jgi:septum formation protein
VVGLVLASASPARLRVLRGAGLDPEVVVSGVEEDDMHGDVAQVVSVLARRKAQAVAARLAGPGKLVLGCDSLLDVDGEVRGKPRRVEEARRRWEELRGREALLRTGHHLIDLTTGAAVGSVASTVVRFAEVSDDEIDAYVATGEPLEVAGGFTLEGRAGPFIEAVSGDPSNVLGVSLPLLRSMLAELGTSIVALWR